MTDRPILFSGPMVRAILDGRKTQTRRVLRPQPDLVRNGVMSWKKVTTVIHAHKLPYAVGDRLWVREHCATWVGTHRDVVYRADNTEAEWDALRHDARAGAWKVRTSIFMPRWASRLTLIVEDVRLQRVQEISREDAIAEGLWLSPRAAFRDLWDRLNAKRGYGWEINPWVAALTFDVHKCNIDAMTCSHCHGTGIVSRPYIAGVATSNSYCRCEAGRKAAKQQEESKC